MTVIVAALSGKHVVVAADRQTSVGWTRMENSEPKLFVHGKYVVGCSGDVRVAQVLQFTANWPTWRPKEDPDWIRFVVTRVVPEMRRAWSTNDVDNADAITLIANRGRFATVYGDGAVVADRSGRTAIGSGQSEALGYLGKEGPWKPADVVTAASRASLTNLGCSGPISVADTRSLEVGTEDVARAVHM